MCPLVVVVDSARDPFIYFPPPLSLRQNPWARTHTVNYVSVTYALDKLIEAQKDVEGKIVVLYCCDCNRM